MTTLRVLSSDVNWTVDYFLLYLLGVDGNRNDGQQGQSVDGENNQEGGNENRADGEGNQSGSSSDTSTNADGKSESGTETDAPVKKGMSWLPIIIIAAAIGGLLLIGLIVLAVRKRSASKGYASTASNEPGAARA